MKAIASKRWFDKYPRISFAAFLILSICLLDILAATFFIPYDYNSFRCPDPFFHHGLLPDQKAINKWGDKEFEIYTNSLGFKDEECRFIQFQSDKKRILFIGDSFTEGVGMNWDESFVGILDKKIPEIEILNAGVVSYSPKLHYLKLRYLIENVALDFNEVFILIDNSDIMDEITYADFTPYNNNSFKKTGFKLKNFFFNHSYIYYTISDFINKSRRNTIAESWNPFSGKSIADESAIQNDDFIEATLDWSYQKDKYEKWGKKGLGLAAQNMDQLIELCRSNQIAIQLVIYPWPNLIQRNDLNNIQVRFWEDYCTNNSIQLINLYPAFISPGSSEETISNYFIPGDVHWNENGNKYVANLLLQHLASPDHIQTN